MLPLILLFPSIFLTSLSDGVGISCTISAISQSSTFLFFRTWLNLPTSLLISFWSRISFPGSVTSLFVFLPAKFLISRLPGYFDTCSPSGSSGKTSSTFLLLISKSLFFRSSIHFFVFLPVLCTFFSKRFCFPQVVVLTQMSCVFSLSHKQWFLIYSSSTEHRGTADRIL